MSRVDPMGPVLIYGGGGFLGTNLTAALVARGQSVINVSRSHLSRLTSDRVTYLPSEGIDDKALVAQASCVFHMAHGSSPAASMLKMEDNLAASMQHTFSLMRNCAECDVPLIYLSSGGAIYGPDVPVPTPETVPTFPISAYGVEKLTAERYLDLGARHFGLGYRVLRISNPYGPWQLGLHGQGVIGTWMRAIQEGQPIEIWGDGSVTRDYVYVDDVIDAMQRAMAYDGAERIFNIGSGTGQSLSDLLTHLRTLCDPELSVTYREAAPSDVPLSTLDTSTAQSELGWQPTVPLEKGLALTWDWMIKHTKEK